MQLSFLSDSFLKIVLYCIWMSLWTKGDILNLINFVLMDLHCSVPISLISGEVKERINYTLTSVQINNELMIRIRRTFLCWISFCLHLCTYNEIERLKNGENNPNIWFPMPMLIWETECTLIFSNFISFFFDPNLPVLVQCGYITKTTC